MKAKSKKNVNILQILVDSREITLHNYNRTDTKSKRIIHYVN